MRAARLGNSRACPPPTPAWSPPAIPSPPRRARACCARAATRSTRRSPRCSTSWVAEPLLTGPGAGGYLLVAGRGRAADAAGLLRRGAGPGRRSRRPRRPVPGRGLLRRRRRRCSTSGPRRAAPPARPAGLAAAIERWGTCRLADARRARRGARPRGRAAQRRAGLHLRDPRADPARPRPRRAPCSRPRVARCARASRSAIRPWPTRSSASAPRAPSRSTGATSRRRSSTGSARAAASSRAPTSTPTRRSHASRRARPTAGAPS